MLAGLLGWTNIYRDTYATSGNLIFTLDVDSFHVFCCFKFPTLFMTLLNVPPIIIPIQPTTIIY